MMRSHSRKALCTLAAAYMLCTASFPANAAAERAGAESNPVGLDVAGAPAVQPPAVQPPAQPTPFSAGQPLTLPQLSLPQDTVVIETERADVTGDGALDDVILAGQKRKDNPAFYAQLFVIVKDGKSGRYSTLPASQTEGYLSGYEPKLFLGDFSRDKVNDVMVSVATGGSGGTYNHLIATWLKNKPSVIFGEKENAGLRIRGRYLNGFKAELFSEVLKKTFVVDVSGLKQQYVQAKVYDENGNYIYKDPNRKPGSPDIFSDPFASLDPFDVDNDGVYELLGKQGVWGPFHYLTFTTVNSTWKYGGKKWNVIDASYTLTFDILENQ